MKNILVCLILSIIGWVYYFKGNREKKQEKEDWLDRFWYSSLDFRVIIINLLVSFATIYFILKYISNEM
ncbi:MAG: hypothetical protein LBI72_00620 [Flavobacteriaceae bacterium]|nr:hypothetical protein [Flavobacteriaceae bacterium]